MLNDEQHEKLKKLVYKSIHGDNWNERQHAVEDMADILDPDHWHAGLYLKAGQASKAA